MEPSNQELIDIVQTKIAQAISVVTAGTGISTMVGYIPSVLGTIATIVGITVTISLWKRQKTNWDKRDKKLDLEIEILEKTKFEKVIHESS